MASPSVDDLDEKRMPSKSIKSVIAPDAVHTFSASILFIFAHFSISHQIRHLFLFSSVFTYMYTMRFRRGLHGKRRLCQVMAVWNWTQVKNIKMRKQNTWMRCDANGIYVELWCSQIQSRPQFKHDINLLESVQCLKIRRIGVIKLNIRRMCVWNPLYI